jgi:hypothetical protein
VVIFSQDFLKSSFRGLLPKMAGIAPTLASAREMVPHIPDQHPVTMNT